MEHSYIMPGNFSIKTPGAFTMSDIKNELVEQTPEKIVRRSTFPNGFQITIEHQAGITIIHCNQPLTQAEDGSFIAPTDT